MPSRPSKRAKKSKESKRRSQNNQEGCENCYNRQVCIFSHQIIGSFPPKHFFPLRSNVILNILVEDVMRGEEYVFIASKLHVQREITRGEGKSKDSFFLKALLIPN